MTRAASGLGGLTWTGWYDFELTVRDHLEQRGSFHLVGFGEAVKFINAAANLLRVAAQRNTDCRLRIWFLVHEHSICICGCTVKRTTLYNRA